jgi:hypothetical protein
MRSGHRRSLALHAANSIPARAGPRVGRRAARHTPAVAEQDKAPGITGDMAHLAAERL